MNGKVFIFVVLGILLCGTFLLVSDNDKIIPLAEKKLTYDCDNLDVVYLKPSEKALSGKIASQIKGISVIPEENYLVADTEILAQCEDLDFSKYIKMENNY